MKKIILITIMIFGSFGCSEEQVMFTQEVAAEIVNIHPPSPTNLKLVNQLDEAFSITSWKMAGYEFQHLDIPPGDAKQFLLVNGMRAYKDVLVIVVFSSSTGSFSISEKVDFREGGVTSVVIYGCGGCEGNRIEWSW